MVNNEGIPIKSTLDSTSTVQVKIDLINTYKNININKNVFQYSAEVSQLAERAKCLVRDLDPTNELTFVRIASKKHEVKNIHLLIFDMVFEGVGSSRCRLYSNSASKNKKRWP